MSQEVYPHPQIIADALSSSDDEFIAKAASLEPPELSALTIVLESRLAAIHYIDKAKRCLDGDCKTIEESGVFS
jgi:hypothetical protein